jgi:hypothetical protein
LTTTKIQPTVLLLLLLLLLFYAKKKELTTPTRIQNSPKQSGRPEYCNVRQTTDDTTRHKGTNEFYRLITKSFNPSINN